MIKIKVFKLTQYWVEKDNISYIAANYNYCVYLFGILIHSVLIKELTMEEKHGRNK